MINNWFKLYLKSFLKSKFFSILNILGLSLGITALILAMLYWKHEKSYDQWNPYKDRVYEVYRNFNDEPMPWLSAPFANQLDQLSDIIEAYNFSYNNWEERSIEIDGRKDYLYDVKGVQASFFEFFPYEEIYGSSADYQKHWQDAIAIDLTQSERLFGKGVNPIGKSITVSEGLVLSIRFVYKIPGNSSLYPKGVVSYETEEWIANNKENNWGDANYNLLIKLKEGIVLADVRDRIARMLYDPLLQRSAKAGGITIDELIKKEFKGDMFYFYLLKDVHLNPQSSVLGAGALAGKMLYILVGASVLLVLLTILNTVNLSLVYGFRRAKEVGVRKTLGSSRRQLVYQNIFETAITIGVSLVLATAMVELVLPYFNLLINRTVVFKIIEFIPLLISVFIILIIVAGVVPALFISSFETLKVLKGNYMRSKSGVVIRNTLLVVQFFIAFFFLTVTIIVNRQVEYLLNQDLGFKGDQVVNINYKVDNVDDKDVYFKKFVSDFKKVKGVKSVTAHSVNFGGGYYSNSTNYIGDVSAQSGNIIIDEDFKETFDITLKTGRFFDPNLKNDGATNILVNESFVRIFNLGDNALGREVKWNNRIFTIIGVVKDMNTQGFSTQVAPCTYFLANAAEWFHLILSTISVKIDTEETQTTLNRIEDFWKNRVDNTYPIKYSFANHDFAKSYESTLYQRTLFMILTVISVFIALFGLIAIVAFSIENRLKEIAIRKVLGAEVGGLIYQLTKKYFIYCIFGFMISVYPVVYLLRVWLEGFAYRIELSWQPFVISWGLLTMFSLVLVVFKAWKATRIDVLKYIKYE
ncbi:ABC transporter permease [Myroides sp. M-43]|uniref:ABC transporter permease n=1 Tax=Myroides oncorhynchi TaxID=2893756 RepID=UPI001E416986|nr:ABC transporter permease [Myroides oncorhynchi]MCC9041904.1 ABC transporter permease [Myroides oncorhynchi]